MLIMVHTPKCGGKSLRTALESIYGNRLWKDYANPLVRSRWYHLKRRIKLVCKYPYLKKVEVIFGHFCLDRYSFLGQKDVCRGMMFRHPVELVASRYYYQEQKYATKQKQGLLDFIQENDLDRFYASFLGRYRVADLDYILITEKYEQSLRLFEHMFGRTLPYWEKNITAVRSGEETYADLLDKQGIYADVLALQRENMRIYKAALERFDYLCASQMGE